MLAAHQYRFRRPGGAEYREVATTAARASQKTGDSTECRAMVMAPWNSCVSSSITGCASALTKIASLKKPPKSIGSTVM